MRRCSSLFALVLIAALAFGLGSCADQDRGVRKSPAAGRELRIEILPDGMVSVQGSQVRLDALPAHLAEIAQTVGASGVRVIVAATEDTPYGIVAQVVAAAREAGFKTVVLMSRPLTAPTPTNE